MKKLLIVVGLVMLLLLPVACGASGEGSEGVILPDSMLPSSDRGESDVYALPSNEERMVVRNGSISLVVEDVMRQY